MNSVRFITLIIALLTLMPIQANANSLSTTIAGATGITLGIYQPPTVEYGNELNSVNALAGKTHGIAQIYINFSYEFDGFLSDQIIRQMQPDDRSIMLIAWEPTGSKKALGCSKDYAFSEGISPTDIINGVCDAYITRFAQQLKARPERFLLKFAHEMNNAGVAWSPGKFNLPPSAYIQEWRHVKSILVAQGVTNVEWVWAPLYQSLPNTPANNPNAYYPGNEYVD